MANAANYVVEQTRRDRGSWAYHLAEIEAGRFRPHRNGEDITDAYVAEAREKIALADGIIAYYS